MSGASDAGDPMRLDLPPPASARLLLPEETKRFIVFGDAEEEFDWSQPFRRDATATTAIAALPEANRQFVAAGCVPTYLVDWPVADNAASAAAIRAMVEQGECDLGAQLHPWVTPPFDEPLSPRNSFTGNLPVAVQEAKLAALVGRIEAAIGQRPIVYRAGRYGVGSHTARLLAAHGFRLDVSVRAGFDYRDEGGPDFLQHPAWPWRAGEWLYEVPLTTAFTGALRNVPALRQSRLIPTLLARSGFVRRVPLTPEGIPLKEAREAIRVLLGEGQEIFSLSFHTPSVVPGHTPYVRDAADLGRFRGWWDGVFDLFAARGVTPIRSGELIAMFDAA